MEKRATRVNRRWILGLSIAFLGIMAAMAYAGWSMGAVIEEYAAVLGVLLVLATAGIFVIWMMLRAHGRRENRSGPVEVRVGRNAALVGSELHTWQSDTIKRARIVPGNPSYLEIVVPFERVMGKRMMGTLIYEIPFPPHREDEAHKVLAGTERTTSRRSGGKS